MKPRICLCCGESFAEHGNALSRNSNVCASCSSLADGMTDSSIPGPVHRIAASEAVMAELELNTTRRQPFQPSAV